MNNDEPEIIDIPAPADEQSTLTTLEETGEAERIEKFAVLPHLLVLGLILIGLFSAAIVPYISALLPTQTSAATTIAPVEPTPTLTQSQTLEVAPVEVKADAVFVWDVATQRVLMQKGADQELPLASITKLMTALIAYELLDDDATVTISPRGASLASGGNMSAGEVFKARELADYALISSFNSAAYGLGDAVGALLGTGDPHQQFVSAMNIRARELNLDSLQFHNSTGLDESTTLSGGYGTARDISFLVEYIYKNYPEILLPTITPETRLYNSRGEFHKGNNTNEIVSDIPGLLGSKTGFTDLAGGNLTIIFDAGYNRPIVVTVLGSTRSERYQDVTSIITAIQASLTE